MWVLGTEPGSSAGVVHTQPLSYFSKPLYFIFKDANIYVYNRIRFPQKILLFLKHLLPVSGGTCLVPIHWLTKVVLKWSVDN